MKLNDFLESKETEATEESGADKPEADTEAAPPKSEKKMSKRDRKAHLTKTKRIRKQLLEKIAARRKEAEKKMKMQQSEIFRLKSIKRELAEAEKANEEKQLKKELEEKHHELFGTKRLGRLKFEEAEIDVKLSDEITGSLRTLKPEGNILTDRYKSLQKRNIIEPRERARCIYSNAFFSLFLLLLKLYYLMCFFFLFRSRQQRHYWKKKFDKRNAHEKTHYIK